MSWFKFNLFDSLVSLATIFGRSLLAGVEPGVKALRRINSGPFSTVNFC